ncbi:fibroblast growth factor receptor-like 1 [Saccoglossus kowalevskii]|uniref:Fibroblast growth factor receptor-like 1-like isoform X1 n=1 Tax=Saccoglossus kowalevskii TaxID=10224 RepID=A0ABM0GTT1_SACKO|nr:PREDICTED: fibroblast growth factor receptor-like 1-like isoform X1 [Saccoglossus kowalevskii]XP_006819548.1 PREDICTED: fibroblast growth factor receptor-like 1-like isoform X2 [Saccoglossus kowalevskii]
MAKLVNLVLFVSTLSVIMAQRGPPRLAGTVNGFQRVRVGRTVKLLCKVEADPPALSVWTKDKQNIHNAWDRFHILNQGLKIKDVELEDAGHYICKATNGFGSITVNYTLTVLVPPSPNKPSHTEDDGDSHTVEDVEEHRGEGGKGTFPRFSQPSKMSRRTIPRPVGSSVRLKCAATGHPRPSIYWLKDGVVLTDEVGESKRAKWTLKLRDLDATDSGKYTCIVKNNVGNISATYTVDVIEQVGPSQPDLIGAHPLNTTVAYGETALFQCRVRSDVKPHIQWLKRVEAHMKNKELNTTIDFDGAKLIVLPAGEVWSRPDGAYLNKLVIQHATEEDAGMYICLGANTMGYKFRTAFLDVLPDPVKARGRNLNISSILNEITPSPSTAIPLPVIIGVPAGICILVCVVMVWCCQQRRKTCSATTNIYKQPHPQRMVTQQEREQFLALHQQQAAMQKSREKVYSATAAVTMDSNGSSVCSQIQHHQHLHVHHC